MSKLPELTKEERAMFVEARDCGGIEVPRTLWPVAQLLEDKGYGTLGTNRGPNGDWKRFDVSEEFS